MEIIATKTVFNCPIFKVEERRVRLTDGTEQTHWVVVKVPNVEVMALDNDHNLVLISVLRGKQQQESLELPGGKVLDYEADEEALRQQALAELLEETGFIAAHSQFLIHQAENTDWYEREFHYFLAWDLQVNSQQLEPGENIRVVLMTLEEVRQKLEHKEFPEYLVEVLNAGLVKFHELGLI